MADRFPVRNVPVDVTVDLKCSIPAFVIRNFVVFKPQAGGNPAIPKHESKGGIMNPVGTPDFSFPGGDYTDHELLCIYDVLGGEHQIGMSVEIDTDLTQGASSDTFKSKGTLKKGSSGSTTVAQTRLIKRIKLF